jgi:hypothetical protein
VKNRVLKKCDKKKGNNAEITIIKRLKWKPWVISVKIVEDNKLNDGF